MNSTGNLYPRTPSTLLYWYPVVRCTQGYQDNIPYTPVLIVCKVEVLVRNSSQKARLIFDREIGYIGSRKRTLDLQVTIC